MKTKILKINMGAANSYLIKCERGYILVDCGSKNAGTKLLYELDKLKAVPDDIKLIIITHDHYDHTGGLAEIRRITKAPVAVHEDEFLVPPGTKPSTGNQSSFLFRLIVNIFNSVTPKAEKNIDEPYINISNEMSLENYGVNAKIIHTPGHSRGSVCILTEDGQCIAGDTLFNMFPVTHYPIIVYSRKLLADTYRKLDELNSDIYYPGHGNPISKVDFKRRIMKRSKYFKIRG